MTPSDLLWSLPETCSRLTEAVEQPDPACRVKRVAGVLRESWPEALVYACQLGSGSRAVRAALDRRGWPCAFEDHRFDTLFQSPGNDPLSGGQPVVVSLGASEGGLGLVLPAETEPERLILARQFLVCLGQVLTDRLALHASRQQQQTCETEKRTLERLANLGEMSAIVTHDFADFLNLFLLWVAILERKTPENERGDLLEIRRAGYRAAELIHQFQQYRRSQSSAPGVVDLREVVREVSDRLSRDHLDPVPLRVLDAGTLPGEPFDGITLVRDLGPGALFLRGANTDVHRLVHFLLGNAVRVSTSGGRQVRVSVAQGAKGPLLSVVDSGPKLDAGAMNNLFEATACKRPGADALELATCRLLARRLNGQIATQGGATGGLQVSIAFGWDG